MNNCDDIRELLSASIDGELTEGESRRLAEHLAGCEACRRELDELRKVWEAVGDATAELISEAHPEILEALTRIEDSLENRSLFSRVSSRINTGEDSSGSGNPVGGSDGEG